jgi:hypothetical protein
MEQIEFDRYRGEIDADVNKLVDKYRRIFGWDIPEVNDAKARQMILGEIRAAVERATSG